MNVSFRNLNEIIHPNASAVFVNESFRNEPSKTLNEILFEGNYSNYIKSYMNFVDMKRTTYKLVTQAKFLQY